MVSTRDGVFRPAAIAASLASVLSNVRALRKQAKHLLIGACVLSTLAFAQSSDVTPPTAPLGLTATAASCGQVDLTWMASTDEPGGSGMKGYIIDRAEGGYSTTTATIGAVRTAFSDTNYVKAGKTITYNVVALDNAGNKSSASNSVSVTTPACPIGPGESVIDSAYTAPLGKAMATYGTRTAVLYIKQNPTNLTWDTWLNVNDSSTGQSSRFMLHASPGYNQTETDYVLTSATELWTLSHQDTLGGNVLVSQYRLNGNPPTSATLQSTKSLGDSKSKAKAMIRLQSGALMVAWNQEGWGYYASDLTAGFAYRGSNGQWTVKTPITIPNSGGGTIVMSQWSMAQHPSDASVWTFIKRDSFHQISAVHLTEAAGNFIIDWVKPDYITVTIDGDNGPEGEYPFIVAAPDLTRNAILLAYQSYRDRIVFIDPLYGKMNSIFLKDAPALIAAIQADGSRTYIPSPISMERSSQFAMSVLPDGTIWLAYHPIDQQDLTWNEVLARKYENGSWSSPIVAGQNYRTYNVASGARDPGLLIYRLDQPEVAFLTPDEKIRSFKVANAPPPPSDSTPPSTSITAPTNGSTVSGVVAVTAAASDNVGVTRVDLLVDGAVQGSKAAAPYTFSWDTSTASAGQHVLQTKAYDAAGNAGVSGPVSVSIGGIATTDTTSPKVKIVDPSNHTYVARNKPLKISADAVDDVGIAKVEFFADNTLLGVVSAAPYSYDWKVPPRKGVVYTLKAVAYDAAGNHAAAESTVAAK